MPLHQPPKQGDANGTAQQTEDTDRHIQPGNHVRKIPSISTESLHHSIAIMSVFVELVEGVVSASLWAIIRKYNIGN